MRKTGLWPLLFLMICVVAGADAAQNADDILSVRILASVERVQPGQPQAIALIIKIKEPYHINSEVPIEDFLVPTSVSFADTEGVRYFP